MGGESQQRIEQLQEAMAKADVDALVVRLPENILLVTGYWTKVAGMGLVFIPREGSPTFVTRDYEESEASEHWLGEIHTFSDLLGHPPAVESIKRILSGLARSSGVTGGAIGYEGSFEALSPPAHAGEPNAVAGPTQQLIAASCKSEQLVDMTAVLETIRAVKSQHELLRLRIVNEIAMFGLEAFKEHARAGRAEAEIAAEVEAAIQRRGHGYRDTQVARAYAMVRSGSDTSVGWWSFCSRSRLVEPNDLVMVELATVADGYWSDHTRTVVAGRATQRQREAFAAVSAAQNAGFEVARAGAAGGEVDAAARAACSAKGFTQFPHHTGHGLGFRYHESRPQLVPGGTDELLAGMVISVEPGIYEQDLGGLRVEDNAVVTETGAVRLAGTDFDFE